MKPKYLSSTQVIKTIGYQHNNLNIIHNHNSIGKRNNRDRYLTPAKQIAQLSEAEQSIREMEIQFLIQFEDCLIRELKGKQPAEKNEALKEMNAESVWNENNGGLKILIGFSRSYNNDPNKLMDALLNDITYANINAADPENGLTLLEQVRAKKENLSIELQKMQEALYSSSNDSIPLDELLRQRLTLSEKNSPTIVEEIKESHLHQRKLF